MAAVSAWAKPGAWALDSEEQEAAMEQQDQQPNSAAAADFPSLAAAKTAKKKKKQTFSLAEFSSGAAVAKFQPSSRSSASAAAAAAETLALPTGPRERSAEELERPRGFGYSSYGAGRESRSREPREPREPRDSGPSRADEVDDWGSMKRSVVPERRERERGGGGGGGFFDSQQQNSRADDSDSWISRKPVPSGPSPRTSGGGRGGFDMLNREVSGADSDTWGKKREDVSPVGSGGAGGRPRLVLQPRSLPVAAATAANGSNGEAPAAATVEGKTKGSNPFGEARPREEVLKEKGKDWKEIDEKLEAPAERKGFGLGNGRPREDRTERAWRKPGAASVAAPPLLERAENVEQLPGN